jgi:transposase-like protein
MAKKAARKKVGRPSRYEKVYNQIVLDYAREGLSLTQISARIDIPRTTMRSWADKHKEFSSTLTRAKELEQAWWEAVGMEALKLGSDFNAAVWKKSVECRFKDKYTVTQKREVTGKDGGSIKVESVAADLIGDIAAE